MDQPFSDELRLAVRAHRQTRGVLPDQIHIRHAVDGGRRGEHQPVDTRRDHALQECLQPGHVLPVVVERPLDGLAHLLLPCDVHHACHIVVADRRVEPLPVEHAADHQGHPGGNLLCASCRQVVIHDYRLTAREHRTHDMRTDISRPTCNHPGHSRVSLYEVIPSTSLYVWEKWSRINRTNRHYRSICPLAGEVPGRTPSGEVPANAGPQRANDDQLRCPGNSAPSRRSTVRIGAVTRTLDSSLDW